MSKKSIAVKRTKDYKKSIMAELNAVSIGLISLMVAIIILCTGIYILMNTHADKYVFVNDEAKIFTPEEIRTIKRNAQRLSDDKDINVVIFTTKHNGFGYSDDNDDYARVASDMYKSECIDSSFRDNSGIVIMIDLTEDAPGRRFFWIYTYGTAYFTLDDDECNSIFGRYRRDLTEERYSRTVNNILDDLDGYNWHGGGVIFTYFLSLVVPLAAAFVLTIIFFRKNKLDKRPDTAHYRQGFVNLGTSDKFRNRTVTVTYSSSGGGHGGGGGGGHSGGGGGHF